MTVPPLAAVLLAQCARSGEMRERYARQVFEHAVAEVIAADTRRYGAANILEMKQAGATTQRPGSWS